jgi:hypothetical protein
MEAAGSCSPPVDLAVNFGLGGVGTEAVFLLHEGLRPPDNYRAFLSILYPANAKCGSRARWPHVLTSSVSISRAKRILRHP